MVASSGVIDAPNVFELLSMDRCQGSSLRKPTIFHTRKNGTTGIKTWFPVLVSHQSIDSGDHYQIIRAASPAIHTLDDGEMLLTF